MKNCHKIWLYYLVKYISFMFPLALELLQSVCWRGFPGDDQRLHPRGQEETQPQQGRQRDTATVVPHTTC